MADPNETVQIPPEGEPAAEPDRNAVQQQAPAQVQPAPARDAVPRKRPAGLVLALAVLLLLAAVIATAFVLVANRRISLADMRTLLELMLGPLFALAGAALGFYFANR